MNVVKLIPYLFYTLFYYYLYNFTLFIKFYKEESFKEKSSINTIYNSFDISMWFNLIKHSVNSGDYSIKLYFN